MIVISQKIRMCSTWDTYTVLVVLRSPIYYGYYADLGNRGSVAISYRQFWISDSCGMAAKI